MIDLNNTNQTIRIHYSRIGNYEIIKKLGTGNNCKVKLGRDIRTNEYHAFKIFDEGYPIYYIEKEVEFLKIINLFNHRNLVKIIRFDPKIDYVKKNGIIKKVSVIVMEYISNGEIFGYLHKYGSFTEEISRTYFHNIINVLEILHKEGLTHGDLKLENILLDEHMNIKITDFSSSRYLNGMICHQQPQARYIDSRILPPEYYFKQEVDPIMIDLFASGYILFTMIFGKPPFEKATKNDYLFKFWASNNLETFWKAFDSQKKSSQLFKDFINSMMAYDPIQRLTLSEIKSHPWFLGTCLTEEQLKTTLSLNILENKSRIDKMLEEKKKLKPHPEFAKSPAIKPMFGAFGGFNPYFGSFRSLSHPCLNDINTTCIIDFKALIAKDYIDIGFKEPTEIFLPMKTHVLLPILYKIAVNNFSNVKLSQKFMKLKVDAFEQDFKGKVDIEIKIVNQELICVEFTRIQGSCRGFYKLIEEKFKKPLESFQ